MLQEPSIGSVIPLFGPKDLDYDALAASAVSRGLVEAHEEGETAEDFFGRDKEPPTATLNALMQDAKQLSAVSPFTKSKEDASLKQMKCESETGLLLQPAVADFYPLGPQGQRLTQTPSKSLKSGKAALPIKSKPHAKDNAKRRLKAKESSRMRAHAHVQVNWSRSTRKKVEETYVQSSRPLTTPIDAKDLPTAQGAYWGLRSTDNDVEPLFPDCRVSSGCQEPVADASPLQHVSSPDVRTKLSDLMENQGFKYQPWKADVSHPVLDSSNRVVTVLVGKPKDRKYDEAMKRLFDCLVEKGANETFTDAEQSHRRGQFPALNIGFAVGPGSSTASRIHVGSHGELVEELLANDDLQRLASHQDASFHAWAPKLHNHYSQMNRVLIKGMHEKRVKLQTNFDRSVYSSMAINFPVGGKSVCTIPHRDVLNLPYGWCAVHALGDFDPKAGGHIILWELKLIVEFPAGACILLPSATVTHFNVPIRPGDLRASITQYTGGNLFRFVDNGLYTDSDLRSKKPTLFKKAIENRETRWMNGLSLLRKYDAEKKYFV